MRPLGNPSFDDKLVQECIRLLLEAIYEGSFVKSSHGFRLHRSCHTALEQIQTCFTGVKWFVEGDIKGFFDAIDHEVMVKILSERIKDERFLRLIRKFLRAGYMEDWKYHGTYSGTPQGGIISPILANIYLDKLDKLYQRRKEVYDAGDRPAFKGLIEIMSAETTIITAIHNIKSNHGSETTGVFPALQAF